MGTGASRTRSSGIVFDVPEDEIDEGCSARALGPFVLTGDGPFRDVRCGIRDIIDRYFDEAMQRSNEVHLHFVRDETVLA